MTTPTRPHRDCPEFHALALRVLERANAMRHSENLQDYVAGILADMTTDIAFDARAKRMEEKKPWESGDVTDEELDGFFGLAERWIISDLEDARACEWWQAGEPPPKEDFKFKE